MEKIKKSWKGLIPRPIRMMLAFVIGWSLIILGLIGLALPVMPGWLLIFVGVAILASEFKAAQKVNDGILGRIKEQYYKVKKKIKN